jgi:microcystin-dependent protein
MAQPYIGEIRMFAGNFAPAGWMFCEGQLLSIAENDVLFSLIGTTYGGDGQTTFALPNLSSRVPMHMGAGPAGASYTLGQQGGTETETLAVEQIPAHTHALTASASLGTTPNPAGSVLAQPPASIQLYIEDEASTSMAASAVQPIGGSQPHENVQPFLCINYIISLFGIFPSQT